MSGLCSVIVFFFSFSTFPLLFCLIKTYFWMIISCVGIWKGLKLTERVSQENSLINISTQQSSSQYSSINYFCEQLFPLKVIYTLLCYFRYTIFCILLLFAMSIFITYEKGIQMLKFKHGANCN